MRTETGSDRSMVMVGLLPLIAGAVWLLMLRQPHPVEAHAAQQREPALVAERQLLAPAQPRFLGVVVAGQDAELGAELAGQIVKVFAEPGERVRRGDPLVQIAALSVLGVEGMARAQQAQDESSVRSAELALETARDKADRMDRASAAYSIGDVQAARSEARKAEAELAKLRANIAVDHASLRRELARADKQILRAPFDGVLAARWVDAGDFVSGGTALARVMDDARFVRFAVPADEHGRLLVGRELAVALSDGAPMLHAKLANVEPELDAAAGLGFARAKLDPVAAAAAGLLPGARVHVLSERASPLQAAGDSMGETP